MSDKDSNRLLFYCVPYHARRYHLAVTKTSSFVVSAAAELSIKLENTLTMSVLPYVFLALTITHAVTIPSHLLPPSEPSPLRTSISPTGTLAANEFNYRVPNTIISLIGSYSPGRAYKLPPAGFNIALFEIHQRAISHIDTLGDGPLLPKDDPMTEVMTRGSTELEPYRLVIRSYDDRPYGEKLTYGLVRDAMDATRGLGLLMRRVIHYQSFGAEIVTDSGELLGWTMSEWVPPAGRFQNAENATQKGILARSEIE